MNNTQEGRISKLEATLQLTSEFMQKQFDELKDTVNTGFVKIEQKIDGITTHADTVYAKKSELSSIKEKINSIEQDKKTTKSEKIKNWGLIIVAFIGLCSAVLTTILE